ncbi:hypothetical protein [Pseudomonas asiatica]|uniref:hypothetical protein n=1 Tax=Pseudomonas asiatica TaxID=2219225 RepID=UPI001AAFDB26|nr:hypothetical protein [Pseudomonas asiatica]MBO2889519.1 hypothetical protein [Pseudomonas asiatica]
MPTENRSSNTDPRDVFIRLNPLGLGEAELRKDSTGFEDQRTHSDYLLFLAGYRETHPAPQPHPEPIAWMVGTAFWWTKEEAERDAADTGLPIVGLGPMSAIAPADQHQGEPVALPARKAHKKGNSPMQNAKNSAWNACLDEIAKLGPLYAHADPGEVERPREGRKLLIEELERRDSTVDALRERVKELESEEPEWSAMQQKLGDENEALRAKLAERNALLNRAVQAWAAADTISDMDATMAALRDALYASAAPSAPVEIGERQEFESAWSARIERLRIRERGNEFYRVQPNDLYRWNNVQDAWELWQARAALERKPS